MIRMAITRKESISKDFNKKDNINSTVKIKQIKTFDRMWVGCDTPVRTQKNQGNYKHLLHSHKNQQEALENNYEINVLNLLEGLAFVYF